MKLINEITTTDRFIFFIEWLVKSKGLGELAVIDAVAKPYQKHMQKLFMEFVGENYGDE